MPPVHLKIPTPSKSPRTGSAKPRAKAPEAVTILPDDTDYTSLLNDMRASLERRLVGRTKVIDALLLGVVAREHVMLEGPHGIAKTRSVYAFRDHLSGLNFFDVQLCKETLAADLFGVLNIKAYQEECRQVYATEGMLPQADFALLDEVYRAPGTLYSTLFRALNERTFKNGGVVRSIPLASAVGTANFVVEGQEMQAFHDRWLIRVKVGGLSSAEDRLRMLRISLDNEAPKTDRVPWSAILTLGKRARELVYPDEILRLYENLVAEVGKSIPISDRRIVQSAHLPRCFAAMNGRDKVTPSDLVAAEYGLVRVQDATEASIFSAAMSTVVGDYETYMQETATLSEYQQVIDKLANRLQAIHQGAACDSARKQALNDVAKEVLDRVRSYAPKSNASRVQVNAMRQELSSIYARVQKLTVTK